MLDEPPLMVRMLGLSDFTDDSLSFQRDPALASFLYLEMAQRLWGVHPMRNYRGLRTGAQNPVS
jgi:hypothetical protein